MRILISLVIFSILMTGCATQTTTPLNSSTGLPLIVEEDKTLGDPLPSLTQDSGLNNNRVYVVGYAEMSANKSPHYISKAALMDGEVQLLSEAPADVRILTQNALVGAEVDSSEFFQMQTKLQEVLGVQSFQSHQRTCRKIVRYGETNIAVVRGCWYRVSASITQLKKAYAFTLAKKYGQGKANQFQKLMDQEINKINNHRRYDDEKQTSNHSSNTPVRNDQSQSRVRNQQQSPQGLQTNYSQRRDIRSSSPQPTNGTSKNRFVAKATNFSN